MSATRFCINHNPIQHRDGKPPWCRECGLTAAGDNPASRIYEKRDSESGTPKEMWVISKLRVDMDYVPMFDNRIHPEKTPIGPFDSREEADAWASNHIRKYATSDKSGGSWLSTKMYPPSVHD